MSQATAIKQPSQPLTQPVNLMGLTAAGLCDFFLGLGEKSFRGQQIMRWLYHQLEADFSNMLNISRALRERLSQHCEIRPPAVITEQHAADGTRKWLLGLPGGNAVETVFIPEATRGTLCVSSQIGCALNCSFCSTGAQGFNRNLTAAEIIGQVWIAARSLGHTPAKRVITNVVMMGMGEPLLNFEPVVAATEIMRDDLGFGLAGRRVTVSTAGLVPKIRELKSAADVAFAVSLHAPTDELRNILVPLNKKYKLAQLLDACAFYVEGKRGARVTFEYTLIDGVNDHPDQARKLARLLRCVPAKINLIPFNPFPGTRYRRAKDPAIEQFRQILVGRGYVATVRRTRGGDIDAACGQLVGRVMDRTRRQALNKARMEQIEQRESSDSGEKLESTGRG